MSIPRFKIYSLLVCALTLFAAISCDSNQYKILGTIDCSFNGKNVMLFKFRNDSVIEVDTVVVTEGHFSFTGLQNLDDIAVISCGNYPNVVRSAEVVLEKGKTKVELDSIPKVSGTDLNILYKSYFEKETNYVLKVDSLQKAAPNQTMVYGSEFNQMCKELADFRLGFIKENLGNPVGRRIFKGYMWNVDDSTFHLIHQLLPDIYKNESIFISAIETRKQNANKKAERMSLIGQKFIDFELKTPDNKTKKLSDFIGKSDYVFIDFWASWCGPCVADIPHLKELYEEYNIKGVEFVSISLDSKMNSWLGAIEKADMQWPNLSELKDLSDIAKAYRINGIPNGLLIDKHGIIIQSELKSHNLKMLLQDLKNTKN